MRNLTENRELSELKGALESLFSQYGKIIDIKLKKNIRHRGQAFISFEQQDQATKVLQSCQGFLLFEKPMVEYIHLGCSIR